MLYPNLFLRKISKETTVPIITAQELAALELFPGTENRWDLREKLTGDDEDLAELKGAFREEITELGEPPPEIFDHMMSDVDFGRGLLIPFLKPRASGQTESSMWRFNG